MSDHLTPAETAAYLGGSSPKSTSTLAQWRSSGVGPSYIKVGGSIRYRRSDLDAWLQSQTRTPHRAPCIAATA